MAEEEEGETIYSPLETLHLSDSNSSSSSGEEEGEGEEKKKKKKKKMKMKKPRSTKNKKRTKRGLKGKIKQNAKGVQKEERSHGVHTAVIVEEVPPPPPLAVEGSRLSRR
ncbi:hypothetical protein SLE2022_173450 [Rubroshorea leprosula]